MNFSSLIPLFDIDWTLLVDKNQIYLDAFTHMLINDHIELDSPLTIIN